MPFRPVYQAALQAMSIEEMLLIALLLQMRLQITQMLLPLESASPGSLLLLVQPLIWQEVDTVHVELSTKLLGPT